VKEYHIGTHTTEPHSPWQNRAEGEIRELKRLTRRALRAADALPGFWCYALEWASKIRCLTAHNIPALKTRTPEEMVRGATPDISEYAHFSWFEWVWYRNPSSFPDEDIRLGRWLGVASDVGAAMTYWIATDKYSVIARSSVIPLKEAEKRDPVVVEKQLSFMRVFKERSKGDDSMETLFTSDISILEDAIDDKVYTTPEQDEYTPDSFDEYLTSQVLLPVGDDMVRGQVIRRRRDHNGRPIGIHHTNPMMDTREYEVEFPDGSTASYLANVIAENLYAQVDEEGRMYTLIDEIIDHECDEAAISAEDLATLPHHKHQTTKGWKLLVQWKDRSSSFVPLREMKNSYPVQTAEYAIANRIDKEPAFSWWVSHVLKKRDRIIQKMKRSKYWVRATKYGIELPKSVAEALEIDKRTGTTFWRDAINKEMKNNAIAFKFMNDDVVPVGYKHITCHMIFDIKMIGLVRKARFVAGGHLTDPPTDSVYSSVVTRESVRIMFLVAALNDRDILGADVQNAYLHAMTKE